MSEGCAGSKTAVMVGAGNIGRGFIGQLLCEWGFRTVFSDVNKALVEQINRYKEYPIVLLSDETEKTYTVHGICAVDGADPKAVANVLAEAELAAVSVGANALPSVTEALARGIMLRCDRGAPPLNILICENLLDAKNHVQKLLLPHLSNRYREYLSSHIGLVETSVGRMIPVQTEQMRTVHPLAIFTETYCELPADKAAFRGGVPDYPFLKPYAPFTFYVQRKMFVHNMGHSAAAYLGMRKGYTYILQAMEDQAVRELVRRAMLESAAALSRAFSEDLQALTAHADDLLHRFQNRRLNDTAERVGRDLPRKLGEDERFFGAVRLCKEQNIACPAIRACICAALDIGESGGDMSLEQLRAVAEERI